jgi:hypothetical protein
MGIAPRGPGHDNPQETDRAPQQVRRPLARRAKAFAKRQAGSATAEPHRKVSNVKACTFVSPTGAHCQPCGARRLARRSSGEREDSRRGCWAPWSWSPPPCGCPRLPSLPQHAPPNPLSPKEPAAGELAAELQHAGDVESARPAREQSEFALRWSLRRLVLSAPVGDRQEVDRLLRVKCESAACLQNVRSAPTNLTFRLAQPMKVRSRIRFGRSQNNPLVSCGWFAKVWEC